MPDPSAPESSHGVPPQGGNGGLIAVGVIMLFLAGGLVYWKSNSAPDEPEVIEETAQVTDPKPEPQVLDNAPPPPPDEEEEPAKEEEKKPDASLQPKASGPAGCSGECKGNPTPALQSALAARGAMARSCYNTALRNNPNLKGRMTMSVRVSPTGGVCSASVADNSLGDQAVASCAAAKFRAGTFPPPTGGCVTVNVPLNFTSKP